MLMIQTVMVQHRNSAPMRSTRRRTAAAALFSLAVFGAVPAGAWQPEDMAALARVTHAVPSPDGEQVAYVVSRADLDSSPSAFRGDLFVSPVGGGRTRQFTFGDGDISDPRWSPDGHWLTYLSRHGGGARLMIVPSDGGGARAVTPPHVQVAEAQWSPSGGAVAMLMAGDPGHDDSSNASDDDPQTYRVAGSGQPDQHLWIVEIDGHGQPGQPRRLTGTDMHVGHPLLDGTFDWSPDGRDIAFTHTRSPALDHWTTADVSIVETGSGRIRQFQQSNAAEFAPSYSPDGEHIAFNITMYPPSWVRQSRVGVARRNGTGLKLLAPTFDEQPRIVGWITGDTVLVEEPHGTHTALWKLPRNGAEPRRFDDGDAVLSAVTLNEPATRLALVTMNRQRPQEAAVTALRRYRPQTVSAANTGAPDHLLGGTRLITWSAADGLAIEGLLTLPTGYRQGQRYPLVLMIHGGPAGVFTRAYPGYPQEGLPVAPLAARGYAVLQANPRGSSGYGYTFRAANRSDWGGADYEDLMGGIDHLIAAGVADPERLGVMGWSYGGFMSAWMVTRSHRFSAAIAGAPVTDLIHLAATTDIGGFLPDYLEGEFWERQDLYRARSPLLQAHHITTPTLVLHGEADVRVPPGQGRALYNALQRRGQTSRLVLYPRAPHLLDEPGHLVHAAREVLDWFGRHLPAGQ